MGENEMTTNLFKNEYRGYTLSVIKATQETTGVSLDMLLDALE
jgi:hypothetical protein